MLNFIRVIREHDILILLIHQIKFQLKKLGVMPPEQLLPVKCNRIYQIIWANNGDAISRQYAGTAALKVKMFYFKPQLIFAVRSFQFPNRKYLYNYFGILAALSHCEGARGRGTERVTETGTTAKRMKGVADHRMCLCVFCVREVGRGGEGVGKAKGWMIGRLACV